MKQLLNPETGRVQLPHPMFDSWGDAVESFVNRSRPEIGSYTAYDLSGRAICGRVSHDASKPSGDVLVSLLPVEAA